MTRFAPALALALIACSGDGGTTDGGTTTPPVDIDDAAFLLNTTNLTIPGADSGLATLVKGFFANDVYIHTYDVTDTSLKMRMAFGDGAGAQDTCTATTDFPSGTISGMEIAVGPQDMAFATSTSSFEVLAFEAAATIADDGESLDDLSIAGVVDMRQAVGFGPFTDAQEICDDFGSLGVSCGACSDNEPFCATLVIEGLASSREDVAISAITVAEAQANCPTSM